MQYYHIHLMKRFNKLGVLITSFSVTVSLVVPKLHNTIYLISSVRFNKFWLIILLSLFYISSVIIKMSWNLLINDSDDKKAMFKRTPFPLETCDVQHSETGSSDGLSPDRSHTIYE
jgi:hypothetical protein